MPVNHLIFLCYSIVIASALKSSLVFNPAFTALFLLYSNFSLLSITTKFILEPVLQALGFSATTSVLFDLLFEVTSATDFETSDNK